jgi:hypothetical protein
MMLLWRRLQVTTKAEVLKTIREKCIDCCAGDVTEVRKCHLTDCALHPFRMAKDPNPSRRFVGRRNLSVQPKD